MGLSTLPVTFLRRLTSSSKVSSLPSSRFSTPQTPTITRRTLRKLTPDNLLSLLHSLPHPLTADQVATISNQIANDTALLTALISKLTTLPVTPPPAHCPRTAAPDPWLVATLLRFGPPPLRQALSEQPNLISQLAAVFANPPDKLHPSHATHVADVIRIMLHDYPRETATALQSTRLPQNLVLNIHLQPAADLIPRLVSHRTFSPAPAAPLVAMHKRAVVMLGSAHVQDLLADAFVHAAAELKHATAQQRSQVVAVLENSASCMAELCVRAMCLQRKHEDVDERSDNFFGANLGIISSHAYNDAARNMTLIEMPGPLRRVLQVAMGGDGEDEVLLPALQLVTEVLKAIKEVRNSGLPSVRWNVDRLHIEELGKVLGTFGAQLKKCLGGSGKTVGRRRLGVVDLVKETCEVMPAECVDQMLMGGGGLVEKLLAMGARYERNEVLQKRVAQILHAVLSRHDDVAISLLIGTGLLEFLERWKESVIITPVMAALGQYVERMEGMAEGKKQRKILVRLVEEHKARTKGSEGESGLLRDRNQHAKISTDLISEMNLEEELTANEDYGQELYLHHLLDEVTSKDTQTPPSDSHISHTAAAIAKGWGKGLSGRLKEAYHHGHHSK